MLEARALLKKSVIAEAREMPMSHNNYAPRRTTGAQAVQLCSSLHQLLLKMHPFQLWNTRRWSCWKLWRLSLATYIDK